MHPHVVQAHKQSREMYQRYKTQLFLAIVFIALLNSVGLYILLGPCDSSNMCLFLFIGSIVAYFFARFGFNSMATHVLICSGFMFQFSVTLFTGNATFRAFLATLPAAVSIFTLPEPLYHMTTWYLITSTAGGYLYIVHDADRVIPFIEETEDERRHRTHVEFATYEILQFAALSFGLFLYNRVQSYVKRTSAIMKEIETSRQEAEAGVRAKDFLATMSHEIRTPLHGVLGMAQILNSSTLSPEQHEYVGEIIVLGNNLISMVTNILDLSRIEAELYILEPKLSNVETLCNTLMCVATRTIPGNSVGMQCTISAGVPRHIIIDSKRVLEVLFPIIASHFTGNFEITFQVERATPHSLSIQIASSENQVTHTWQTIINAYSSSVPTTTPKSPVKIRRRPSLLASTLSLLQTISKTNTASSSDHAGLSVALCLRILTLMNGSLSIEPTQPPCIQISIPFTTDSKSCEKYEKDIVINSSSCSELPVQDIDPHDYEQAQLRYHITTCNNLMQISNDHSSRSTLHSQVVDTKATKVYSNNDVDEFIFDSSSGPYYYRWLVCILCIGLEVLFAAITYLLDGANTLFQASILQIGITTLATLMMKKWPDVAMHLILLAATSIQQFSALYYDNHMIRSWSAIIPYIASIFTVPKFEIPLVAYTCVILGVNIYMYLWHDVQYPPTHFVGTKEQLWDRVVMDVFILSLVITAFSAFAYFSLSGILHLKENVDSYLEKLYASKRAAEAGRRAGSFLSIVSHNIRTPLHSLLGATQLLSNTEMSTDQLDCALQILSCGNVLMSLVTNVLNLSQMDSGMFVLEEHPVQLQYILQSTLDVLSVLATQKGIELSGTIQPGVPKHILGDSKYLLQILLNITGNAVKFTSKGYVKIEIKVEATQDISLSPRNSPVIPRPSVIPSDSPPRHRLLLMVHDTGPGLDESVQTQIFQPYMQGDQSNTRTHSGSGLGLAICLRLVALMNGDIGMSSKTGSGSTFWVAIPLRPATVTGEEAAEVSSPIFLNNLTNRPPILHNNKLRNRSTPVKSMPTEIEAPSSSSTPIRILIVDDNALNVKVASRALCRIKSAIIDVATNGEEALDKITNGTRKLDGPVKYTTIFMDVQMPVMDGIEATRRIRKLETGFPPVYIVGLSAHAEMEVKRCLDAGMNQFIGKPFPVDELVGAVLRPATTRSSTPPTQEEKEGAQKKHAKTE